LTATAPAAVRPVLGGIAQDLQSSSNEAKWSSYGSQDYRVFAGFDQEALFIDNFLAPAPVAPVAVPAALPAYQAAAPLRFQSFSDLNRSASYLSAANDTLPALPSDEELDLRLKQELRKSFELLPDSQPAQQLPPKDAAPADDKDKDDKGGKAQPEEGRSTWRRSLDAVLSFFLKI
jgi:hypothetical protein